MAAKLTNGFQHDTISRHHTYINAKGGFIVLAHFSHSATPMRFHLQRVLASVVDIQFEQAGSTSQGRTLELRYHQFVDVIGKRSQYRD